MSDESPRILGGRYRLGTQIGEGGFGAVYEAQDVELQRLVAVKLLDPMKSARDEEQAAKLQDRFYREAVAMAAIVHPNVVTVFDIGMEGNEVYIVMERLQGCALSEELERWPTGIEPRRALPLFVGALEGLAAGHAAGIVHKDLKPENLFLVDRGSPREKLSVIDFGVARLLHEQRLTATGKLVGTPRYLAPEYIEHLEVTPALDVYQVGLILVEVLSAMPCVPRRLDLVTCCQRHVDGALKIPEGLRLGAIGEVIARALAREPAARYADANEFASALAAVDPETVSPTIPGSDRPTPRLGVKPLRRETQPMHGGANALRENEAARSAPPPSAARRHPRTGPTKRLGAARDIAGQLAQMADEPVETSDAVVEPRPSTADVTTISEFDPLAARRRTVYMLLVVAIIVVTATWAFFALGT